jgi:16S rRNA (adenine1518-N6/adenine1519-N6)-dimethyltransferase
MRATERLRPRARKRFGQHFLEPVWARKVIDAVAPASDELFVEIGPGTGAMTRLLAERARAIVACEIDRDLAAELRAANVANLRVINGDFLDLREEELRAALADVAPDAGPVRIAGNLPYNVASPIMFHLVDLSRRGLPIADATLMLQREVAERLLAPPGTAEFGVLTVLIGHRASVTRLLNLPPGAFRPMPKVQSTVVRLRFHAPDPPVVDEQVLGAVTNAVFSRRRKTLGNALQAHGSLTAATAAQALHLAGIDPARRPETLTIAEFGHLADTVAQITNRQIVPSSNRQIQPPRRVL